MRQENDGEEVYESNGGEDSVDDILRGHNRMGHRKGRSSQRGAEAAGGDYSGPRKIRNP